MVFQDLIDSDMIRDHLDSQIISSLTDDQDDIIDTAIKSAVIWAISISRRCGVPDDIDDYMDIVELALIKRSIYELYSRSDVEADADDKAQDALNLMVAVFGDCAKFEGRQNESTIIVGGSIKYDRRQTITSEDWPPIR